MEIPVYLFTGFLESGKTKFIQETLCDPRFNDSTPTLLIVCEEGFEDYDPSSFASDCVTIQTIENESDVSPLKLGGMRMRSKAERVVIEYNGMWQLSTLFKNLPEEWIVYQNFLFFDATTFLDYNQNMRSLVVDKLNNCELVVFNRFRDEYDKTEFHKIVRAISRRTDIAYEYGEGRVEYDDIVDPLPFDVNAPLIVIGDNDYALWFRDLSEETEKYNGKTVRFKCRINDGRGLTNKDSHVVGRPLMTCCVQDIRFAGLTCRFPAGTAIENGRWIDLTAKLTVKRHKLSNRLVPLLDAVSFEPCVQPDQEVATFY